MNTDNRFAMSLQFTSFLHLIREYISDGLLYKGKAQEDYAPLLSFSDAVFKALNDDVIYKAFDGLTVFPDQIYTDILYLEMHHFNTFFRAKGSGKGALMQAQIILNSYQLITVAFPEHTRKLLSLLRDLIIIAESTRYPI